MPAVQSTYPATQRKAVAGMIANTEPVDFISRTVEDAAGVGFGVVMKQGARDNGATKDLNTVAMDAYTFLGVTVRQRSVNPEVLSGNGFAQYESVRLMRKGVIWVQVDGAVVAGSDVTVTLATGALGTKAVGAGIVAIPNARWDTSAADLGLAQLRLG